MARKKATLYLLIASIIWAFAAPISKFTLDAVPPFIFLSYRFFLSAIISVIYFVFFNKKSFVPKKTNESDLLFFIIYAIFTVPLALSLLTVGLSKSSVLELGLIGALGPLLVTVGGAIFLKEKIYKSEKIGVSLAFIGTLVTILAPVFQGKINGVLTGNILLILFLFADAIGILAAKKLTKRNFEPSIMVNFSFILGAIFVIPATIYSVGWETFSTTLLNLDLQYHLGVIYMAFGSGTIAYLLFFKGQKLIEAGEASLFAYLHPVLAMPLAIFWLGERMTLPFVIGAIFITLGVFVAEYRTKR